jgi:hypothetical protein
MRIFEVFDEQRGTSGLAQVLDLLDALHAETRRDPVGMRALSVLLLEAAIGADEPLHRRFVDFHVAMVDELAAVIARGIADGSVRADRDAQAEALAVVSSVRGLSYLWVLDPDRFDGDAANRHLRALVEERLAPA